MIPADDDLMPVPPRRFSGASFTSVASSKTAKPNKPIQNRPKDLLYQQLVGEQLESVVTRCDDMASKCLPEAFAKRTGEAASGSSSKKVMSSERPSDEIVERPKPDHPWRRSSLMILEDVPTPALPRRLSVGSSAFASSAPPPPRPDPNRPLQNRPKDLLFHQLVGTQLSSNITNCDKVASKCLPQVKPRKKAFRKPGGAAGDGSSDEDSYDDLPLSDKPEDRLRRALLSCQGELQKLQKLVKGGPRACGLPPLRDADRTRFSQQTFSIEEAQREFCNDRLETALRLCLMNLNVLPPTADLDEEGEDEYEAAAVDWADVPLREDQEEEAEEMLVQAEIHRPEQEEKKLEPLEKPEKPEKLEDKEGRAGAAGEPALEESVETQKAAAEEESHRDLQPGQEEQGVASEEVALETVEVQEDADQVGAKADARQAQGEVPDDAPQQPSPEKPTEEEKDKEKGKEKDRENHKEKEQENGKETERKRQQSKNEATGKGKENAQEKAAEPRSIVEEAKLGSEELEVPSAQPEAASGAAKASVLEQVQIPACPFPQSPPKRGTLESTGSTTASPAVDKGRTSTSTAVPTSPPRVPHPPHGSPRGARSRPRQQVGQGGLRMSPGFKTFSD